MPPKRLAGASATVGSIAVGLVLSAMVIYFLLVAWLSLNTHSSIGSLAESEQEPAP